jgi:glucose-1-phosphate cytidylyltransferase
LNFENLVNDFTLRLRVKTRRIKYHDEVKLEDWNITFVNTGVDSQTGSRLARVRDFIGQDQSFFLTYGDGVARIDIHDLLKFHKKHGKIATITGVRPPSRFGEIVAQKNKVIEFNEKPAVAEGYINGGFFVFNREIFEYVNDHADCALEREPLEALVKRREMMLYSKVDFWHCMDTYRDFQILNDLWNTGQAAWKV